MILSIVLSVVGGLVIFIGGIVCGVVLSERGHKRGVKLMDRVSHDQVPFGYDDDNDSGPEFIQTYTDGTYEEAG